MAHSVPRVAVQGLLEAFLVEGVAYEADGARQHKQAVQVADLHDVLDLRLQTRWQDHTCARSGHR